MNNQRDLIYYVMHIVNGNIWIVGSIIQQSWFMFAVGVFCVLVGIMVLNQK